LVEVWGDGEEEEPFLLKLLKGEEARTVAAVAYVEEEGFWPVIDPLTIVWTFGLTTLESELARFLLGVA
jgi:hypothetical protein